MHHHQGDTRLKVEVVNNLDLEKRVTFLVFRSLSLLFCHKDHGGQNV